MGTCDRVRLGCPMYLVSIPYKRESTWEQELFARRAEKYSVFQFPTNGKAHGNVLYIRSDMA